MDFLKKWTNRRVLVTGGTGFIGQHVLAHGQVAGVQLFNLSSGELALSGVHHCKASLRDHDKLKAIIDYVKPEAIIHLAAGGVAYGSSSLTELLHINTLGTQIILEAADKLVRKPVVVLAGTGFEYGIRNCPLTETELLAPFSAYGVSKAATSLVANYYAQRMVIILLRLFSIYGPGEKSPRLVPYIIEQVRQGKPVDLTAGEQVRNYTFVKDIAEAFWRSLIPPHVPGELHAVNVSSEEVVKLRVFVEMLASILEDHNFAPDIRFGTKLYRPDEPMHYVADVTRLKSIFGWVPSTRLEAGLHKTVEVALERAR